MWTISNFIGLDITCGSAFECYGGLLIRSIQNIETGEEIDGCAKVLNYLVSGKQKGKLLSKKWSDSDMHALHEIDDSSIVSGKYLSLEINKNIEEQSLIFIGKREHGQKVDDKEKEKYNVHNLKAISNLSKKKTNKFKKIVMADVYKLTA